MTESEIKSPAEVAQPAPADKFESFPLVILAFKGTEDQMAALWRKACPDYPFILLPVDDDYDKLEVLAEILIDEKVEKEFVLVPANTFPAGRISPASLCVPRAYLKKDGTVEYDSRFPILIQKDRLEELLAEKDITSETLFKAIVTDVGRPELAGMSFGNVICPVVRSNPCEHVVIEALLKKIFIGCSRAGWDGISSLIDKLVADE